MRLATLCGWAAGVLSGFVAVARAADLFIVNAQTTSGTPMSLNVAGHNLTSLVTDLVQSNNQFASLSDRDASLLFRPQAVSGPEVEKMFSLL